MIKRIALIAALAAPLAVAPYAAAERLEASKDAYVAHPAVGEWLGEVSWSERRTAYAWFVSMDGTFESGGADGGERSGGTWSARGARLVLKYANGFRYDGELSGDDYSGVAYTADGAEFGSFAMRRQPSAITP